jgi:hypothetical protein
LIAGDHLPALSASRYLNSKFTGEIRRPAEQSFDPMRSQSGGVWPWEWDMNLVYKANALDCIRLAKTAADADEKAVLLALAQAWVKLSEQAAKFGGNGAAPRGGEIHLMPARQDPG